MTRTWTWMSIVTTCALLAGLTCLSVVRAFDPAESPDTTRLIDNIEKTRSRRALESTACLQALARQYEAEPHSACVDVDRLRDCLGVPLIMRT